MKTKPPEQDTLFPLPPEEKQHHKPRWYYVSDPTGQHVLVLEEGQDKPHFVPADLQYIAPYLWNHAATAHADLRRWAIKGTVVLYPFSSRWWETDRCQQPS